MVDTRRCGIGEETVEKACSRSEYVGHPKDRLISADIRDVERSTGQPGKEIYPDRRGPLEAAPTTATRMPAAMRCSERHASSPRRNADAARFPRRH